MIQLFQTTEEEKNTCKKDRTNENGLKRSVKKKQRKKRKIKSSNKEVTESDNARHLTGPDNTNSQQKQRNAGTARERGITKRCVGHQYVERAIHQQRRQQKLRQITENL